MESSSLNIRKAIPGDYERGHVSLLAQLTSTGEISADQYSKTLDDMTRRGSHLFVVHDTETDKVVGSATLLVEQKLIHGCACVGHIEDVVVGDACRGKGVGKQLIAALCDFARANRCYKVILDCSEENCGFYAKCGFQKREVQMRLDC